MCKWCRHRVELEAERSALVVAFEQQIKSAPKSMLPIIDQAIREAKREQKSVRRRR